MSQDFTSAVKNTSPVQSISVFSLVSSKQKQAVPVFSETPETQERRLKNEINQLSRDANVDVMLIPLLAQTHAALAKLYWSVGKKKEGDLCKQNADAAFSIAQVLGIFQQEEKNGAHAEESEEEKEELEVGLQDIQAIDALIDHYETKPEHRERLQYWSALKAFLIMEQKQVRDEVAQNNTQCKIVCTLVRLAEIYLSQYMQDKNESTLNLAAFCSNKAHEYIARIMRDGLLSKMPPDAAYLYIPFCMQEEVLYITGRVEAAQQKQALFMEEKVLGNFQHEWSEMLQANPTFQEKHGLLSMLIYLSGRLNKYALQITYLEAYIQMSKNALPYTTQAKFLLSSAYSHVGRLEEAGRYLKEARQDVMHVRRFPHDALLFEEMKHTCMTHFETVKHAIEAQEEAALLAQAMALSLAESAEAGDKKEEEQDQPASPVSSIAFGIWGNNMFALFGQRDGEREESAAIGESCETVLKQKKIDSDARYSKNTT